MTHMKRSVFAAAAVAAVVLVGIGAYFGVQRLWPSGPAGIITTAQEGTDWPTARLDWFMSSK